jgi:hypothetical protein
MNFLKHAVNHNDYGELKMKIMKKLKREEMKNVTGGIPPGYGWSQCDVDGTIVQELVSCDPCPHCTTGGFISSTCNTQC